MLDWLVTALELVLLLLAFLALPLPGSLVVGFEAVNR